VPAARRFGKRPLDAVENGGFGLSFLGNDAGAKYPHHFQQSLQLAFGIERLHQKEANVVVKQCGLVDFRFEERDRFRRAEHAGAVHVPQHADKKIGVTYLCDQLVDNIER
jgi:hypothetical protein